MHAPNAGLKLAASLGLIAVLGPSAIDMYLPSMPDMARDLNTSYAHIQLTLTVFLLALGAGQLLFGPLADAYGRRRPLLAGIAVFILASLWASVAPSIDMLLWARVAQGLAAALTLVAIMSTVRDVAEGTRAAQLFALLMTIQALAPVLAPVVGGYLGAHAGWTSVMLTLAGLGVVVVALGTAAVNLPETLPRAQRTSLQPGQIARTYARIARNPRFLVPALALSATFFFLFAYIGGASLAYQTHHGLAPDAFGLVFGATGTAVLLGAMAAGRWVRTQGMSRLAIVGVCCMTVGATIAALAAHATLGLPLIVVGMFIAMFGLGMAESTLMALAMASQQQSLGSTAALLGAFQLVIASAATPLAGKLAEQGTREWLTFLSLFGVLVLLLTLASATRARSAPSASQT